jgi:hypothetical protein
MGRGAALGRKRLGKTGRLRKGPIGRELSDFRSAAQSIISLAGLKISHAIVQIPLFTVDYRALFY